MATGIDDGYEHVQRMNDDEIVMAEMMTEKQFPIHGSEPVWTDFGMEDLFEQMLESLDYYTQCVSYLSNKLGLVTKKTSKKSGSEEEIVRPILRKMDQLPKKYTEVAKILDDPDAPLDSIAQVIIEDLNLILCFFTQTISGVSIPAELAKPTENYTPMSSEIRTLLNTLLIMLPELDQPNDLIQSLMRLCQDYTLDNAYTESAIPILSELFNRTESDPQLKASILDTLLVVSASSKLGSGFMAGGALSQISDWIEQWQCDSTIARNILKNSYKISENNESSSSAKSFLLSYLKSFENDEDEMSEETKDLALTAIRNAVTDTSVNITDLMEVSNTGPVMRLCQLVSKIKDDDSSLRLCSLLKIQYSGCLNDLSKEFNSKSLSVICQISDTNADRFWEAIQSKMRILTLCSLPTDTLIDLDNLCQQMEVSDSGAAEEIIIDAVMKEFIEAKIDHQTNSVSIESSTQRNFDPTLEWNRLSDRIGIWIQNTNTVLQVIRSNTAGFSSSFAPESF